MLAWLSVWSEMQTCIWPSWCHCHSMSLASVKSRLVLPFWYQLTWVVPDKVLLMCMCVHMYVCVVRDLPCRPLPEETFTHTHTSWSSDIFYQLPPSTMIHSILLVQVMCLTVLFHNLSSGPLWSTSWSWTLYFILYAFLHTIIILFLQDMPIPSHQIIITVIILFERPLNGRNYIVWVSAMYWP